MIAKLLGNVRVNDAIAAFKTYAPKVANPTPSLRSAITNYNRSSLGAGALFSAAFVSAEAALLTPAATAPFLLTALGLSVSAAAAHGYVRRHVARDFVDHLQSSGEAGDASLARRLTRVQPEPAAPQMEFTFA